MITGEEKKHPVKTWLRNEFVCSSQWKAELSVKSWAITLNPAEALAFLRTGREMDHVLDMEIGSSKTSCWVTNDESTSYYTHAGGRT